MNKQIIAALLVAGTQAADKHHQSVQLVEGILNGAIGADKFGDMDTCVANFEGAMDDITNGIDDINKEGLMNTINGLASVGKGIDAVAKGLPTCKTEIQTGDIAKLDKMSDMLVHPKDLIYHLGKDLIVNGAQLKTEFATAVIDYKLQRFYALGKVVGKAAAKALVDEEVEEANTSITLQVMKGVVENFKASATVSSQLSKCIKAKDLIGNNLAFTLFTEKLGDLAAHPTHIKEDWFALFGAIFLIGHISEDIEKCSIDKSSWDFKGLKFFHTVSQDPSKYIKILSGDVLFNGIKITAAAVRAAQAAKAKNFVAFGGFMGDFVHNISAEEATEETLFLY
jgi:hypothetical protein